jgi:hypothetical protein
MHILSAKKSFNKNKSSKEIFKELVKKILNSEQIFWRVLDQISRISSMIFFFNCSTVDRLRQNLILKQLNKNSIGVNRGTAQVTTFKKVYFVLF